MDKATYSGARRSRAASLTRETTSTLEKTTNKTLLDWQCISYEWDMTIKSIDKQILQSEVKQNLPWFRGHRSHRGHQPLPVDRAQREDGDCKIKYQCNVWWDSCFGGRSASCFLTLGPAIPASPLAPSRPLNPCGQNQWASEDQSPVILTRTVAEKCFFCSDCSSKLTLCPLIPGSPGVPGNPRAPCRRKTRDVSLAGFASQLPVSTEDFSANRSGCTGKWVLRPKLLPSVDITHLRSGSSTLTRASSLAGLTLLKKTREEVC